MSNGSSETSRRCYLAALAGVGSVGSLAGCSSVTGGSGSTPTPPEPVCEDAESATDGPYGEWLPRLGPREYTGSKLAFVSADPQALGRFRPVREAAHGYLLYPKRAARMAAVPWGSVERVTTLRPPGQSWSVYAAFRYPGDPADRRGWIADFRLAKTRVVSITRREERRGYTLYHVNQPAIRLMAADDEHVLVVPDPEAGVSLDVESRFERLVDTRRAETPPYHCHSRHALALVERLPPADLTFAWIRTDDGTFGSGNVRVPDGARASAFTARLDWPGRGTDAATTPSGDATDATAGPTGSSGATAGPTGSSDRLDGPVVDLGMVVVFPDGDVDVATVRDHVRGYRGTDDGGAPLQFSDPGVERDGRVVTVAERRPVARS